MEQHGLLRQVMKFLWQRKLYWLVPIVVCFVVIGALIFVGQGSVISPFVYALF